MPIEAIVLALASAVRPASLAAVYALLSRHHPRLLLLVYIAAGFVFSAAIGVIVVCVAHGASVEIPPEVTAVIDLVGGAAALGIATGIAAGRMLQPNADAPPTHDAVMRRLRDPTVPVAAGAGVATHLPGLFYIVALNAIIDSDDGLAREIFQVLVYNAIWFSASVAAVIFFLLRPSAAREAVARLETIVRAHQRPILTAVFASVGVFLVAKALLDLVG